MVSAFGVDLWTHPAELAGLPHARRGRAGRPARPAGRPRRRSLRPPADRGGHRRRFRPPRRAQRHGERRRPACSRSPSGSIMIDTERVVATAGRQAATATRPTCAPIDGKGMGVSLIQSNAAGFGSGLAEPNTGINLHNRGLGFNLREGHPAEFQPGHRPPHTLVPGDGDRGRRAAQPSSARWAATPSRRSCCRWRRACSTTASRRLRPFAPGAGRCKDPSPGSTRGPAARHRRSRSRATRPTTGWPGSPHAGTRSRRSPPYDSGFGHAHAIVIDNDGFRAGAADPRTMVGTAAGI